MKISIITVTLNAGQYLEDCILSVLQQDHLAKEYILIDGRSSDQTSEIVGKYRQYIDRFICEEDAGMYDALNKGIRLATGDVVGVMHADDFFSDGQVLSRVAAAFRDQDPEVVYGDLDYVSREDPRKVVRRWRTNSVYCRELLQFGWMPAHPTFYAKRELFSRYGFYRTNYGSSSDYELMLRFMYRYRARSQYLGNRNMVSMRIGGISTCSMINRLRASYTDFLAMRDNGLIFPPLSLLLKPVLKLPQFICIGQFSKNRNTGHFQIASGKGCG